MATASRHGLNEASHLLDPSINTRTAYENKPLVLRVIFLVAVSLATGFGEFKFNERMYCREIKMHNNYYV